MPRLLVSDANILIDLAIADKCELLALDGYQVLVSVDVYYELNANQQAKWRSYTIDGRIQLTEADEDVVADLRSQHSTALSDPDLTFFALLQTKDCIGLSGDRKLVNACRRAGYVAHGLLWLLDQHAVESANCAMLHATLSLIMRHNDRLPRVDCDKRLKDWSAT